MANLQDIFNLAKADGGKFFVMDEAGEPKLVIMTVDEYQTVLLGKIKREVQDVEEINREILKAQLQEAARGPHAVTEARHMNGQAEGREHHRAVDMREEVIDPSFDFEGPKLDIEDL